jgi:hypothetical protein
MYSNYVLSDQLTATYAIEHCIPTTKIPPTGQLHGVTTGYLNNICSRITQLQQIVKDNIIQPLQSHWKLPILVVAEKLEASGKRKWRLPEVELQLQTAFHRRICRICYTD